nr:MAG TPA: hypothetical protein [Caudoviricetes sp.]
MLKCSELKQMVKDNGGFSINPLGECPKTGYMVSVRDLYKINLDIIDQDDVNFASDIAKEVNGYIGGWLDTQSDSPFNFYMDISINIQNKEQALKIARENNQLAIFDVVNCETIYL